MWFFDNKKSWILFGLCFLAAAAGYFFLPDSIAVHWSGNGADGFGGKVFIFLLPAIQGALLFFSEREGVKEWFRRIRGYSDQQYYMALFIGVLALGAGEFKILYSALAG